MKTARLMRTRTQMNDTIAGHKKSLLANRRNRGCLTWAIIFFIGLQVSYHFPVTRLWPQLHDFEMGEKLQYLRKQLAAKPANKACIVALGSSLTGWAFNPSELTTVTPGVGDNPVVFNFAINSGGVIVELVCLRRLLDDGIKPDLIVLETHPQFLFRAFNTVPGEHYLQLPRYQWQDLDILKKYDPKYNFKFVKNWLVLQSMPWMNHRHELQNYFVPSLIRRVQRIDAWTFTDRNGWETFPESLAVMEKVEKSLIVDSMEKRIDSLNNNTIEDRFKDVYREIIDTCHNNQIPVVLVRMPETSYARATYSETLLKQVNQFYTQLCQETNTPFIEAQDWVPDDEYSDGFHVHPRGARTYMRRLEKEVLADRFTLHR